MDRKQELLWQELFIVLVTDIYLLDDPINTVDVNVGKAIIYDCLNGYLKDKKKILVTHALNYCQFTDYFYLTESG